ncbi:S-layer homology domain-containing protein [Paenibacillus sophorae]|uniref:S-layer homology domain-containing protein n=1 Tax=Paenibacillus sophorae TaxID=1333845 RepID=A0A1H8Q1T8_9BACL|nr:S-layer homology domain-containing protein [Paenibacillus sophorae]QWU15309.1 S-layer homology domain-containing protein [Paenibacillus sophorae]SEO47951.1 S-layer homology domain-containing protein [Paenibacillus sophorae]
MKKSITALILILLLSTFWQVMVTASETVWFTDVSASADASAKQGAVTGKVASGAGQLVTLKVVEPGGQFFLDSVKSGDGGVFTFKWNISAEGKYEVQLGVENSSTPYKTSFTYGLAPSPTGAPTPTPSPSTGPGPGSGSGGSGAAASQAPSPSPANIVRVTEDKLTFNEVLKEATFNLGTGAEAHIPAALLEKLAQNGTGLNLAGEEFTLKLSVQTLRDLLGKASKAGGGEVAVSINKVAAADMKSLLELAKQHNYAELKPGSDLYEFEMKLITSGGAETAISAFDHPVTLQLKANGLIASKLAGIYYISDAGELEYTGSLSAGGWLSGKMNHFSKYTVLEYRRTFTDVPAGNWAYDAVTEMAAKHIVEGISLKEFAPARKVTRAEFAALLVRALGLSGGSASFTDVPAGKWYADEVVAAHQAGIVKGLGAASFKPEQTISREEMAAMLVRAWSVLQPQAQTESAAPPVFKDQAAISVWARDAASKAAGLGLMKGRSAAAFVPQGTTTRAEAAQAIANLLNAGN